MIKALGVILTPFKDAYGAVYQTFPTMNLAC